MRTPRPCHASVVPAHQRLKVSIFIGKYANNDFPVHDAQFRQSERDWHSFVEKLTEKLTEIDDTVPELPVKDVVSSVLSKFQSQKLDNLADFSYLSGRSIFV